MLLQDFKNSKVEKASFNMNPLNSPGPDDLARFFQQHWNIVGQDNYDAVLLALNTNIWTSNINDTFIVLNLKTKHPNQVYEFRPISLCNFIYKVIAKVLANRLKTILPNIISLTQNAFILRRLISNNVLVAFEALHSMHCRLRGPAGYMASKLDMSKTYDRLAWSFIHVVMERMGFARR